MKKTKIMICMGVLLCSFSVHSQTTPALIDAGATQDVKDLWCYLNQIYGKKVLSGIWEKQGLTDVKNNSGKVAAVLGEDMSGWSPRQSTSWTNNINMQMNNVSS